MNVVEALASFFEAIIVWFKKEWRDACDIWREVQQEHVQELLKDPKFQEELLRESMRAYREAYNRELIKYIEDGTLPPSARNQLL